MINRRQALARLGALFAGGMAATGKSLANADENPALDLTSTASMPVGTSRPLTIAHITDVHLFEKNGAEKWFAECLHQIQSHPRKPALILNTGDSVMETLKSTRDHADAQWKLWRDTLQRENSLPIYHCLGNHDIWGLAAPDTAAYKSDPSYGKKLGLDGLGIEKPYYSFNQGGWHFVAMDSISYDPSHPAGWIGGLDDEQFAWLEQDLASTPKATPVVVYSHLPILHVCWMRMQKPDEDMKYIMGPHGSLGDARRVIDLFAKHPNVKLCLSGHIHLLDRIELAGVMYICDGAVSGGWWKGPRLDVPAGYSLTTLNSDGTFEYEYVAYGWNDSRVEPEPKPA